MQVDLIGFGATYSPRQSNVTDPGEMREQFYPQMQGTVRTTYSARGSRGEPGGWPMVAYATFIFSHTNVFEEPILLSNILDSDMASKILKGNVLAPRCSHAPPHLFYYVYNMHSWMNR